MVPVTGVTSRANWAQGIFWRISVVSLAIRWAGVFA
jgi:hypothetical protein